MKIRSAMVVLVAATAATAAPAQGGLTCGLPVDQVFLPWADPTPYRLATNGGFERGADGWSLNGAKVVGGNEPFYLNSPSDKFSLSMPAGSSATSPWSCASVDGLITRLVAQASGSPLGSLQVDLLYRPEGKGKTQVVGLTAISAAAHSAWAPTAPIVIGPGTILADALDLDVNTVEIAFRFRASSGWLTSATWRLDDLYVDPWADRRSE